MAGGRYTITIAKRHFVIDYVAGDDNRPEELPDDPPGNPPAGVTAPLVPPPPQDHGAIALKEAGGGRTD